MRLRASAELIDGDMGQIEMANVETTSHVSEKKGRASGWILAMWPVYQVKRDGVRPGSGRIEVCKDC